MADFNGNYLTCRSATEVAGTARSIKTIIEDKLTVTLPADLAVMVKVQNQAGAGSLKLTHLTSAATHYVTVLFGTTHIIYPGNNRIPLSQIFVDVAVTNDALAIEVVFE